MLILLLQQSEACEAHEAREPQNSFTEVCVVQILSDLSLQIL